MSNSLEKFIRDNRDVFEQDGPSAGLWGRLAEQLPGAEPAAKPFQTVHRQQAWVRWAWAASVAVLLLIGGLWWTKQAPPAAPSAEVAAFGPSYAKEVAQYASLIDAKRTELQQLTAHNPTLYGQFAQDLNRLEQSYKGLKKELPNTPNQEVLIQAMIQNLQLQIDLLNEQLRVIQRIKQHTTTNELT